MKENSRNIPHLEYLNNIDTGDFLNSNILNNIDAFIFIFDVEELKPVWINDYFEKKMGYINNDLTNRTSENFLTLFHPKSMEQFLERIKHFNSGMPDTLKTVYQLKTKSGEWIYIIACSRIHTKKPGGSIKYLLGYASEVDTSELTRHIKKIKELNTKCGNISLRNKLSHREMDMIYLIAKGLSDKEIAEKLKISIHTTKTHKKRIISKLSQKNTAALVKFAVENGIG